MFTIINRTHRERFADDFAQHTVGDEYCGAVLACRSLRAVDVAPINHNAIDIAATGGHRCAHVALFITDARIYTHDPHTSSSCYGKRKTPAPLVRAFTHSDGSFDATYTAIN